jgi:hypothetical protein
MGKERDEWASTRFFFPDDSDEDDNLIQKERLEGLETSAVLWSDTVDHTSNDHFAMRETNAGIR